MNKYCTNARIDKVIYKIRDEKGADIDMPMMKWLPINVVNDIFEEEFTEMYKCGRRKNKLLDFKKLHKLITERCKNRLIFIVNNNLGDII